MDRRHSRFRWTQLKLLLPAAVLGAALVAAPITVAGGSLLGADTAAAKSEKSKGNGGDNNKGGSKNKKSAKNGSSGGQAPGGGGGANAQGGGANAQGGGSDRGGSASAVASGKPKRTDWSREGGQEYRAAVAAWKEPRGQGRKRVAPNDSFHEDEEEAWHGPNTLVGQYAYANDLKQGDLASLLRSWNSLNRNEQAFLNNVDNLASLPGRQLAYIRDSMNAGGLLADFEALGGDPENPPTDEDLMAAQDVIAAQAVLDAEAVLAAQELIASGLYEEGDPEYIAASELVGGYEGDPQAVVDAYEAGELTPQEIVDAYEGDPDAVIDQHDVWDAYQTADAGALDAFLAASVSYSGDYDEATMEELRLHVDGIIALGEFGALVADDDPAADDEVVADAGEEVVE